MPLHPARRHRAPHLLLGLLLPGLLLGGCGGDPPPPEAPATTEDDTFPLTLRDDGGREVTLEEEPFRILSLVPSASGILLALGEGDRLVGRTDFDEGEELRHLPSVGGGLHPSLETVVALEPELVIRFEGESDQATPRALDRAEILHLGIRPDTIGDIQRIIRLLARVTRQDEAAERMIQGIQQDLERIRRRIAEEPPIRVAFLLGGDPPWVVGAGTFLHELLEVAGGENVFGDAGPLYAPVSVEEILRRSPDLILATEGARIPSALSHLELRRVPADVQAPGHRLAASAVEIARVLHPERGW